MNYYRVQFFDDDKSHFHNKVEGLVSELTLEAENEKIVEQRARTILGSQVTDNIKISEIHGYYNKGCQGSQSSYVFVD